MPPASICALQLGQRRLVAGRRDLRALGLEVDDRLAQGCARTHRADPVGADDPTEAGVALDQPPLGVHLDLVGLARMYSCGDLSIG